MAKNTTPHFELKNAAIQRGEQILLKNLSFVLPAGGKLWLRGGNGAGKSSLIRMIAGFLPLISGEMRFGGESYVPGKDKDLPMQFVGHETGLSPVLTGRENLRQATALIGADMPSFDQFDIEPFADRPVRSLSAGQTQRIALTRLCASPPHALWLLDEPDTALDADNRQALYALIDTHCKQGGRAILATHRAPEDKDDWDIFPLDQSHSAEDETRRASI